MKDSGKIKILVLDDEINNTTGIKSFLRKQYDVFTTTDVKEAENMLSTNNDIAVVLCDQRMPDKKGTDFLQEIRDKYPDVMRILFTAFADNEVLIDSINKGWVYKFIQKPVNMEELEIAIKQATDVWLLKREDNDLARKVIGYNEQMKGLLSFYLNKK